MWQRTKCHRGSKRTMNRSAAPTAAVRAARELADDLNNHRAPRPGLRVKRVQTAPPGVLEMTWAPDGRATFEFGREVRAGHRHVVWPLGGGLGARS